MHSGDLRRLVDGVSAPIGEEREQDGAPRRVGGGGNQAVELGLRVRIHLGESIFYSVLTQYNRQ
jgi:hypothetical protein